MLLLLFYIVFILFFILYMYDIIVYAIHNIYYTCRLFVLPLLLFCSVIGLFYFKIYKILIYNIFYFMLLDYYFVMLFICHYYFIIILFYNHKCDDNIINHINEYRSQMSCFRVLIFKK